MSLLIDRQTVAMLAGTPVPPWSCGFGSTNRATLIEGAFGSDKCWRIALENPNMRVFRLFTNYGCHDASDTADFHLNKIMLSFATPDRANQERILTD
jgi:hypothetical protein